MAKDILELLDVPTRARSEEEQELLDDISFDSELKNRSLRKRVLKYMQDNNYSLVSWYHYIGIKKSFEDTDAALNTRKAYKNKSSLPKIIGIRCRNDYN